MRGMFDLSTEKKETAPQIERSLHASLRDGVSHAIMLGCGETFLGPFAVFLRATTIQIGLLATLPQFFGAIIQWGAALAIDRLHDRRRLVALTAAVQALVWVPVALLVFWPGQGTTAAANLVGLATVYHGATGVITPVWNSLIGDLVPAEIRGRFFGHRNRLTGISTFIALLAAGGVLHFFQQTGIEKIGFPVIFLVALATRLNSVKWLQRYDNPEFRILPEAFFTFRQFLRRAPKSNFAQFVFFVGAINFAVAFSSPYFALYMLRDLKFSYLQFTAVTSVATITQFLTFRYWGELCDRFGNKKILNLCGLGISIVPMLWLCSANIYFLMLIQVYGGFVWAGFSLASANFLFDAVSPPKRARCVAYRGLVNGVCVLAGSLLGGFVAIRLPHVFSFGPWTWTPPFTLPLIFFLSGVLRLVAAGFFLRKFREVRPVEPIRHRELIYRVSHIKPIAGATFSLIAGYSKRAQSENRTGSDK
jgi:MFS family permease